MFHINESLLDKRFLDFFIRTPNFRDQVSAQGSTNYAAIRPNDVLGYQIPLPPIAEQRRIVARIEELAAKVEEARGLRSEVSHKCDALCRAILFCDDHSEPVLTPMAELIRLRKPDVTVQAEETYHFAGVYSFGRGVFRSNRLSGLEFSYKTLTRLKTDDFVYPKLMAWEGALGIVPPECDGLVVSPEFPVFEVDQNRVLPETLDVYFRTPSTWDDLSGVSSGTNVRRRRIHPSNFLEFRMPLPTMANQLKLREVKRKVDALKRLQQETERELNALLPAILDRAFKGEL